MRNEIHALDIVAQLIAFQAPLDELVDWLQAAEELGYVGLIQDRSNGHERRKSNEI